MREQCPSVGKVGVAPRTETREQSQDQVKGCHYCMEGSQAALGHTVSTQYVLMILTRLESPTSLGRHLALCLSCSYLSCLVLGMQIAIVAILTHGFGGRAFNSGLLLAGEKSGGRESPEWAALGSEQ